MDDIRPRHPRDRARRFHASYHSKPKQRSVETHGHTVKQFKLPQAVSADEEQQNNTNTAGNLLNKPVDASPKKPKKSLKQRLKDLTVKQWIIIGSIAGVLLIGGGAAVAWAFWPQPEPPPAPVVQPPQTEPEPATVPSNLTGLEVDPSVNERPVIGVMIENSMAARPQSGFLQAGVVFEAIAEGGITRFLALYQDHEPDHIGPVRSIRTPWLEWILGFDGALAHVGGSPEAMQLIRTWGVKDLDQFQFPDAYWRANHRAAPHNMYTSIQRLQNIAQQRGFDAAAYTPLERKDEQQADESTAREIHLNVSSANYNVRYMYDRSTNGYKRYMGGQAHTDERTGDHIAPKVVVALVMRQGNNGIYTTYDSIGSGRAYIFQDGRAHEATWHKSSRDAQFTFTDSKGEGLGLNPGQTWFTVVGSADRVVYNP